MAKLLHASISGLAVSTTCDTYIYFVRHGQTVANRDKIRQGHTDYPLTDNGIRGAELAGDALSKVPFDQIICSDLTRAYKTCEMVMARSRYSSTLPISSTPLVREINFGIREGLHVDWNTQTCREHLAKESNVSPESILDYAETDVDLFKRHTGLLDMIKSQASADTQHVLCVTHGGFIRSFLRHLIPSIVDQKIENCSITVVRAKWNAESKEPHLALEPSQYNYIEHLLSPESYSFTIPKF
jgi:broad specificity phosphatase PhoE